MRLHFQRASLGHRPQFSPIAVAQTRELLAAQLSSPNIFQSWPQFLAAIHKLPSDVNHPALTVFFQQRVHVNPVIQIAVVKG